MQKGIDYIGVSAGAMIFDDKGQLFLSKRGKKCRNERGYWETPGGSVEFGETLEQAAKREILEEYGAEIDVFDQFPATDHLLPKENQHWVATTFLARFKPGQEPKIMEPDKCDEIGWFDLDQLPQPLSLITQADLKEYHKRQTAWHKLYRFSPIKSVEELVTAVHHTHFACYRLCKQLFGEYYPNSGNIGIFCHYDHEFELLKPIWRELTRPSDDPNTKYFELHEPIVVPAKRDVPETIYTHLYIRRPDPYRAQVGDVDFYIDKEAYAKLKQSLIDGTVIPGARIFDRGDLDMIELYDPDIDALGYVSTERMSRGIVRTKQSEITKL